MGEEFNYAEEFKSLDLDAVIQDLKTLMTDSQDTNLFLSAGWVIPISPFRPLGWAVWA
jgi:catalase (peroxidase I)